MIAGLLIIVVGSGCGYGAERRTDQKTEEIKEPESEENRKEDSLRNDSGNYHPGDWRAGICGRGYGQSDQYGEL